MSKAVPYFSIGANELYDTPYLGDTAPCPKCGIELPLGYGKNAETGDETRSLAFVKCNICNATYLVGMDGHAIGGRRNEK